jgi:hypothetical protein
MDAKRAPLYSTVIVGEGCASRRRERERERERRAREKDREFWCERRGGLQNSRRERRVGDPALLLLLLQK